jgi:tetratricopeptide (TPR) repeat protein
LEVVLTANSNLMVGALLWADRDEFDSRLAEYARVAAATGAPTPLVLSAIDHAGAAALDGRYEDARDQFRDALRRSGPLGDPNLRRNIGAGMIPVNRELGRLALRVDAYRRDVADALGYSWHHAGLIRVLAEAGEFDEATERLEGLLPQSESLLSGFLRRYSLAMLSEAAEILGHTDAASQLSGWMKDQLRSGLCVVIGPNTFLGAVDRYLGLLASTLGDTNEAIHHHEVALDVHDSMRARGWAARSRYDLSRALLAQGDSFDSDRSATLIDEALSMARALAMPKLTEEVLALKTQRDI